MRLSRSLGAMLCMAVAVCAQAQIFYKIEGNGLAKPSYLFGTHHLAPLAVAEKLGAGTLMGECEQVVGEIDMTQDQMQLAAVMQPHMMAPADSTLSKVITPADMAVIGPEFKKWAPMPGLELGMLEPMKPMAVTTMISVTMAQQAMPGFDPAQQLDTWFQTAGVKNGKKVVPLETVERQATVLFDTTPISYQAEALVELLKDPAKALDMSKRLTRAYEEQDLDKMLALSEEENQHPEFMVALLDNRNADWLAKLPAIMNDGPSFIAVGALHLAGKKGLVEGLRKAGYTVTPIIGAN